MIGTMMVDKQIKDDLMCSRLTNDNYLVVCQGRTVKAKVAKRKLQRQSYLKRLIQASF
jgi:hypothetical protein